MQSNTHINTVEQYIAELSSTRECVNHYQLQICELVAHNDLYTGEEFEKLCNEVTDSIKKKIGEYDRKIDKLELNSSISNISPYDFLRKGFGVETIGTIHIKYHDYAIEMIMENETDFIKLYNAMGGLRGIDIGEGTEENITVRGVFFPTEGSNLIVINGNQCGKQLENVLAHERQHVRYSLIGERRRNMNSFTEEFHINEANSNKDIVKNLSEYFTPLLESAVIKAKDEIIARTVDQTYNYRAIYEKGENAPYDYTFQHRKQVAKKIQNCFSYLTDEDIDYLFSILFLYEYREIIGRITEISYNNKGKTDLLSIVPVKGWHRISSLEGEMNKTDFSLNISKQLHKSEEFLDSQYNIDFMNNRPLEYTLYQLSNLASTIKSNFSRLTSKTSPHK